MVFIDVEVPIPSSLQQCSDQYCGCTLLLLFTITVQTSQAKAVHRERDTHTYT